MEREPEAELLAVRWGTPPPSAVDERLVVGDDGRARLDVLRPRTRPDSVGTYAGAVSPDELGALSALGREVWLDLTVADPDTAAVGAVAGRVADRLRESPVAVAQFFARPVGEGDGGLSLAVGVVGRGERPVGFELDVPGCAVHFTAGGAPLSWTPLPALATGFMSVDAEGLGGVRQRAAIRPGVLGAISVEVRRPAAADGLTVQLVGRWYLDGGAEAEEFEARTEPAPLGR